MAKRLVVMGNTFMFKDSLKKDGFRWNPEGKNWFKISTDEKSLDMLAEAYAENGLKTSMSTVNDPNEKKYFVKESWIFNLESMHDKIYCLSYDIRDKKIELPFTVAGKTINSEDDLWELLEEASDLEGAAKFGKVSSRQYGRIKEIVAWRVEARYVTCLAAGMSEAEAGKCFEDM